MHLPVVAWSWLGTSVRISTTIAVKKHRYKCNELGGRKEIIDAH